MWKVHATFREPKKNVMSRLESRCDHDENFWVECGRDHGVWSHYTCLTELGQVWELDVSSDHEIEDEDPEHSEWLH